VSRRSTRQKDVAVARPVSRRSSRVGRGEFLSGFCSNPASDCGLCRGEFQNGKRVVHPVVLCTCGCHGDLGKRRTALRDRLRNGEAA
jgi:hypothetical protein